MNICANLSLLFTDRPLRERVVAAAAAGFDGVEIQFPYELAALSLREALTAAGMPLRLINLPAGDLMDGGAGLAAVPSRQAEFDAALEQALSYAAMARPAYVNVLPGRLAEGLTMEQALTCLRANLHKTAEAFALLKIGVLCEAINPLDMPGFLINTPAQLAALLSAVAHPNLSAQLDLYHMARQSLDIEQAINTLAPRIGHVQFADYPGRGAPGTGEVDFAGAWAALSKADYRGWLGAEYRPGGEGFAWLQEWRESGLSADKRCSIS